MLKGTLSFFSRRLGDNAFLLHKVEELAWYFLKGLLSELSWVVSKLSERHELDDVSLHVFLVFLRV